MVYILLHQEKYTGDNRFSFVAAAQPQHCNSSNIFKNIVDTVGTELQHSCSRSQLYRSNLHIYRYTLSLSHAYINLTNLTSSMIYPCVVVLENIQQIRAPLNQKIYLEIS